MSNRKYAIITGFMGSLQDRFATYAPKRSMEEMVRMASEVKGASGLEVVYPQNFTDPPMSRTFWEDTAWECPRSI